MQQKQMNWHSIGVQQLESLLGTQKFYAINKTARHEWWQPAHNNALSIIKGTLYANIESTWNDNTF